MDMRGYVNNQKGMTLIEVLAAVVVLSIVIFSFVSLSQYRSVSETTNANKSEAIRIAQYLVQEVRYQVHNEGNPVSNQIEDNPVDWSEKPMFQYTIQSTLLEEDPTAISSSFSTAKSVSMQTILYDGNDGNSYIVTVTVSWGGSA